MTDEQLDRHTDGSALAASAKAAQVTGSLASLDTVAGLLTQLSGQVLVRYGQLADGEMTPEAAANEDLQACWDLALIFTGGSDEHAIDPAWHKGPLAAYLRKKLPLHGVSDEEVVAGAFGVFVHHIYDNLRDLEDEAALQAALVENIRSFAWALTGLDTDD